MFARPLSRATNLHAVAAAAAKLASLSKFQSDQLPRASLPSATGPLAWADSSNGAGQSALAYQINWPNSSNLKLDHFDESEWPPFRQAHCIIVRVCKERIFACQPLLTDGGRLGRQLEMEQ